MRNFYPSDSCSKESQPGFLNPQSWLLILPHYKPLESYIEVLAQIHEELESSPLHKRSILYLLQYQVFRGLGETKLGQRSLRSAWQEATTVHEKVVFGSWLRYEKQGEEVISDLLSSCGKHSEEFVPLDIASYLPVISASSPEAAASVKMKLHILKHVVFKIGEERIACDRNILKHVVFTGVLTGVSKNLLLEVLVFANKFCCERLKDACDRELASLVSSMECAIELGVYTRRELPDPSCIVPISSLNHGRKSFILLILLFKRSLNAFGSSTLAFLEKVVDFAEDDQQRALGFHRLGCIRLLRKEYREAEESFETAFHLRPCVFSYWFSKNKSHQRLGAYEKLTSVISSVLQTPLGWMYQERSLYCEGDKKLEDLEKATELDPTLTYPYMYRVVTLMSDEQDLGLAREHASSDHERLVYEGWILYDTGHCEEGLQKAKQSVRIKRSFDAYALAESSLALLEDALKCPSDRLRKGQALNNLGSVYLDCEKLDLVADCYINALKVRHTRAHQGLARVHFLRNDKAAAYEGMTRLIEKAQTNASAYEKRSEYCDRELAKSDLEMVTRLDPLRVYPYRYQAACYFYNSNSYVLMDSKKEREAVAELSRAISFKADLHLLHLRAAFHEHTEDVVIFPYKQLIVGYICLKIFYIWAPHVLEFTIEKPIKTKKKKKNIRFCMGLVTLVSY
ncbi:hypothetical protein N665_0236s0004 [Sinapis alba]|nr:hypothetical protein N665_0236s0004 [Sinapis alba]